MPCRSRVMRPIKSRRKSPSCAVCQATCFASDKLLRNNKIKQKTFKAGKKRDTKQQAKQQLTMSACPVWPCRGV
ncbi:unnamed protein product, partial [Brenthis ino]